MGTLTIGTLDVSTVAHIEEPEGILGNGGHKGDLIEFDFEAGAEWLPGEFEAYSWAVGLLMRGDTESAILTNLRTLQALVDGTERTLTRTFTATSAVSETCQGVVTACEPAWDMRVKGALRAVLMIQQLTEWA